MLLYIPVLVAGVFICVFIYTVIEARRVAVKYSHLPWVGAESPSWWALIKCRFTNVLFLRRNHTAIAEKVSIRHQHDYGD